MTARTRGEPVKCFNCDYWSITEKQWRAHSRICWNGCHEKEEALTEESPRDGQAWNMYELRNNSVFDFLCRGVYMSAEKLGRLALTLHNANIFTLDDLMHCGAERFEAMLVKLHDSLLRGRLERLRKEILASPELLDQLVKFHTAQHVLVTHGQ